MNDISTEIDMSKWFSTYSLLTSQRILELFKIHLSSDELVAVAKNPRSLYYLLLKVPLKNVFNGIMLQQAKDYQVYAQKIFIDYLLSGEASKEESSPGANTREDLEDQRIKLMALGTDFNKIQENQQILIASSQASLIHLTSDIQNVFQTVTQKVSQILHDRQIVKDNLIIQQALRVALIDYGKTDSETLAISSDFWLHMAKVLAAELDEDLRQQLSNVMIALGDPSVEVEKILATYLEQTEEMGINIRSYRSQFYNIILRTTELINLLPDYRVDHVKEEENRSSLHFDPHIGGD